MLYEFVQGSSEKVSIGDGYSRPFSCDPDILFLNEGSSNQSRNAGILLEENGYLLARIIRSFSSFH